MAKSNWITNLESIAHLEGVVEEARLMVSAATNPTEKRTAEAALARAKFILADVKLTMANIDRETGGRFAIGEPMATEWRTKDEIAAQGIVGIYRQGAGDGA